MARKNHPLHIVIALYTGFSSNRDILTGILRYASERRNWSTDILQLPLTPSRAANAIQNFSNSDIDGVITTGFDDKTIMELVRARGIGSVVIRSDDSRCTSDPARNDPVADFDRGIGELGARYFLKLGQFNSFGFFQSLSRGMHGKSLMGNREIGFRAALTSAGKTYSTPQDLDFAPSGNPSRRLDTWLESLPKPAAIMCFCDHFANQVLQACRRLKFVVPNQVSILGVDNDTLICENVTPSISSIDPNHQQLGYQMARLLDSKLCNRPTRKPRFVFSESQVVVRESTSFLSPSAILVRRGLSFIKNHALENIGVDDVVSHLGVSRRLAVLRFHEIENTSIRQAIEDARLQNAARSLKQTRRTVKHIAAACGYSCQQTFLSAFKRHFGVTPRQYRE